MLLSISITISVPLNPFNHCLMWMGVSWIRDWFFYSIWILLIALKLLLVYNLPLSLWISFMQTYCCFDIFLLLHFLGFSLDFDLETWSVYNLFLCTTLWQIDLNELPSDEVINGFPNQYFKHIHPSTTSPLEIFFSHYWY